LLRTAHESSVAILTIDRPTRRNAIGSELISQLDTTFRTLDRDDATRAIVLTGSAPGFCAGSDLKELGTMDLGGMCHHEAVTAALARSIALLAKPVIAAVEGFALGGGFALATSCDLIVTTPICRWHMPEVTIGWIPPWGLESLVARCGPVRARRLAWGSEPIGGNEAFRLGVVDYVVPEGAALREAAALAGRLAGLPGPAVAATKQYFAQAIAGMGEPRDAEANRMFADNCRHDVAKATLKKYGVRNS